MHKIYQICHFSSLSRICLGCKTISRRAAHRLNVLHSKQNLEIELKWQTCSGTMPSKFSCLSGIVLVIENLVTINVMIIKLVVRIIYMYLDNLICTDFVKFNS
jgi:hypothetical protein